jgi:hypothetical protein
MAQQQPNNYNSTNNFWQHVQFGGGIGLGLALDTQTSLLHQVRFIILMSILFLGLGAQYSYLKTAK